MGLLVALGELFFGGGGPSICSNRHMCLQCVWEVEGCHFQEPLTWVFRPLLAFPIRPKDGEHTVGRLPPPSGAEPRTPSSSQGSRAKGSLLAFQPDGSGGQTPAVCPQDQRFWVTVPFP